MIFFLGNLSVISLMFEIPMAFSIFGTSVMCFGNNFKYFDKSFPVSTFEIAKYSTFECSLRIGIKSSIE